MTSTTSISKFRRHVHAAAGIYRRLDQNAGVGRNAEASYQALEYHIDVAGQVLADACRDAADPLPEYLDSPKGRRLADAWNRLERRAVGLTA